MTEALPLIQALMRGATDASEEAEIIEVLRRASADDLNHLLDAVDLDALVTDVDDRVIGPDNLTVLLRLLADQRRDELTIPNQAKVIHAMQIGRTGDAEEALIAGILLSRHGLELTQLKNQLNLRADEHDLEGLVYVDLDSDEIRARVLEHFASEALGVEVRDVKVLSDIDDTAFSKLHETRYPKGTLIPGILALYQALDNGPLDAPTSTGDLTFVTARPKDALGLIETHTKDVLIKAGVSRSSILQGGFTNLTSKERMAAAKLANMVRYLQMFGEYDLVWIGDSGQGDIITGLALITEAPDRTRLVLIHDVLAMSAEERDELRARGVHVVDTYVAAGIIARDAGLISDAGLAKIITETVAGFEVIAWDSPEQEAATRALLDADLSRVTAGIVTT